jgi:hypothetical protein
LWGHPRKCATPLGEIRRKEVPAGALLSQACAFGQGSGGGLGERVMDSRSGSPDRQLTGVDRVCCISQARLYIFTGELRVLGVAKARCVPMANEWRTITKARFGVRTWPSHLL